jgi:hypothetical protein
MRGSPNFAGALLEEGIPLTKSRRRVMKTGPITTRRLLLAGGHHVQPPPDEDLAEAVGWREYFQSPLVMNRSPLPASP